MAEEVEDMRNPCCVYGCSNLATKHPAKKKDCTIERHGGTKMRELVFRPNAAAWWQPAGTETNCFVRCGNKACEAQYRKVSSKPMYVFVSVVCRVVLARRVVLVHLDHARACSPYDCRRC